jgi:PTH2 family peptidyl-tRNA hydrolase
MLLTHSASASFFAIPMEKEFDNLEILNKVEAALRSLVEYKQVIVVRNDLKMGKGKLAVQVAHASISSYEVARRSKSKWVDSWLFENQAKICVKVDSEQELRSVKGKIDQAGLPNALIQDAGLTQLEPGTVTCLGIGPCPSDLVDRYTGTLKLL